MTITESLATDDVIHYVMANLWERSERELEVLGIVPEAAIAMMTLWREMGYPSMAWIADDEPVFVIGLVPNDLNPRVMTTWFLATEGFKMHRLSITRGLRRKVASVAKMLNLAEVEIFSPCTHPDTGRWFGTLGFELDVDRHPGYRDASSEGTRLYRFVRRFQE